MSLLKLLALDSDDLTIISAHVQDALVKVKDIVWQPKDKCLVLAINRFAWENEKPRRFLKFRNIAERHFAVLRFDRIEKIQARNISIEESEDVLSLLAINFEESDSPQGTILLEFSGDRALRLNVECIECQLGDLGPVWQAKARPSHY